MEKMITQLNEFLSDLEIFNVKLQNYHWNVTGKGFFVTHEKLEKYYDEIREQIDEIAEHILALGGQPLGTLKDYLQFTKIAEAENKKVDCSTVFNSIITDYSTLLEKAICIKKQADTEEEYKTSAIMDNLIENYTKKLWILKQSME